MRCIDHPDRPAVASCMRCGRPLCDLCVGTVDGEDLCPQHWEQVERRIQHEAYGLPPMAASVSIAEVLIGVWGVIGAVSPWLPWYRSVETVAGNLQRTIDVAGWEAGGLGAVISLVLLAGGIVLDIMVVVRLLRPRVISPSSIGATAIPLGAVALGLLAIRVALSHQGMYTGLYLAIAAAALQLFLGRRVRIFADERL